MKSIATRKQSSSLGTKLRLRRSECLPNELPVPCIAWVEPYQACPIANAPRKVRSRVTIVKSVSDLGGGEQPKDSLEGAPGQDEN